MKKLINAAENYVEEALEGLVLSHLETYKKLGDRGRVIGRQTSKHLGKVGVASGGGFGHLPLFAGYVGEGLLDTCAVGDVFAGPPLDDVDLALRSANYGAGVLAVIGNYGGDRMIFEMAAETLRDEGIETDVVIVNDDVASASPESRDKRRGVAGVVLVFKIAGAAAEAGYNLVDLASVTRKANERCRSIGVALSPCTVPNAGKVTFELDDDVIEMGMGIHGEQGVWRGPLKTADKLADEMLDRLLIDYPLSPGSQVALLCNSLGATPMEELYILYRRLIKRLSAQEVKVVLPRVGHYATSMEMAGASVTLLDLDDELSNLLHELTKCPFWRNS